VILASRNDHIVSDIGINFVSTALTLLQVNLTIKLGKIASGEVFLKPNTG
jgi:hypothetical protein